MAPQPMPGGKHDSSKTRVRPVFDLLSTRGRDWVPQLLSLPSGGCCDARVAQGDLTLVDGHWDPHESCLDPPVSLLSWLIRNLATVAPTPFQNETRQRLLEGDPATVQDALERLRSHAEPRGWHIFEGPTCPDVYLVTKDALVVIEGKRTEATITTDTTWLRGRHQIWRHLDAAWEIRGRRAVYGFFIVESEAGSESGSVPDHWRIAGTACLAPDVLHSSFPHRSEHEVREISRCYLGVTTWRHVCESFGIDWRTLPDEVAIVDASKTSDGPQ